MENTLLESHYLGEVKEQYENYPYPPRNPEDEKKRLIYTSVDPLAKINHYCFRGKRHFDNSFRALVAGAGTGDAVIYLAEQLRDADAQIVYLDISTASMEIAKRRAQIRELDNIEWVHGSLLDIPQIKIGEFDYISCTGVLHHLENPIEGLNALKSALKQDGAVGIMVYGRYGRTGIYQIQELMKMINVEQDNMQQKVENTRTVLGCLPKTNWFKKSEQLFSDINDGDIVIFDYFLHSQDRAFTVPQLYDWLNDCGLNLLEFAEFKASYRPEMFIKDNDLLQNIKTLPIDKQQAVAELIVGALTKHTFYASGQINTVADPNDPDIIPFFCDPISAEKLFNIAKNKPTGATMEITQPNVGTVTIALGKYTKYLFKYLNGYTTLKKCFKLIQKEKEFRQNKPADGELFSDFIRIFNVLNLLDFMLLRHQSVRAYKTLEQMQKPIAGKYRA